MKIIVERLATRPWAVAAAAISVAALLLVLATTAGAGPIAGPQATKDPRELGPGHNPAPLSAGSLPPKSLTTPSPWVSPQPVPGIVQSRQAPFPSSQYSIENQWFDQIGSGYVVVYAGSDGQVSDQGLLVVESLDANQKRVGSLEVYRTPIKVGALRVTAAQTGVLTLQATTGAVFLFDVSKRTLRSG